MSENGENNSHAGFDTGDHQAAYIYTPGSVGDHTPSRLAKRRKVGKSQGSHQQPSESAFYTQFEPRLDNLESPECAALRRDLFEQAWSATERRIQIILDDANEDTLLEVATFVNSTRDSKGPDGIPAGFIVTGPNIASQGLLFKQLSVRLKSDVEGPVVVLQSGDASNLKGVLKQLIRDATKQKPSLEEEDEGLISELNGRKLLNYDLEILHTFVKTHQSKAVVISFQDSEAFDTILLADLIILFSSWLDRIPFVLLFGIATSVELFHGRLSRAASRCIHGAQFDVEQTSSLLERIFQTAVGAAEAPLRLSTSVVSSLMDRQQDHSQSVQSFIAALKYIYMCHFYENALSILSDNRESLSSLNEFLQPEHFQAIRTLPSYRYLLEKMVDSGNLTRARDLLEEDNTLLLEEIRLSLTRRKNDIRRLLRAMHLLSVASSQPISQIELYMTTFEGQISESGYLRNILDSVKRMTPEELIVFIQTIYDATQDNLRDTDVDKRIENDSVIAAAVSEISTKISKVVKEAQESGKSVRSSYVIHSKGLRTTVIAQRVQLSYENSTLSDQDKTFTILVDQFSDTLVDYFTLPNPQDMFLNETWLYDTTIRHRSVFQPRPRAAIERALSAPYDYINCACCESVEGLSSTHPATAILYQMYLETGSLINIYDLWSAFFEMISGGEEHQVDERDALVLFYRALADLKSLGMVKQSKKKTDHLAKVAWKGL